MSDNYKLLPLHVCQLGSHNNTGKQQHIDWLSMANNAQLKVEWKFPYIYRPTISTHAPVKENSIRKLSYKCLETNYFTVIKVHNYSNNNYVAIYKTKHWYYREVQLPSKALTVIIEKQKYKSL